MASRSKESTSIGLWMWFQFVLTIPLIGFIMMIVWSFKGTNEQRKNYFKARLIWVLLILALWIYNV